METLVKSMTGDHPARPCVVLSNRPDAGGLAKAASYGVATETVDHRAYSGDRAAFESVLSSRLEKYRPDIICLAGFMRILTPDFVNQWEGRMLNIHPSLLPKYRGLHTHARAIAAGDREAGCTVHVVTGDLDDGPILGQVRVPIFADDTPEALASRVLVEEHKLYPAVLRRFVSGNTRPLVLPGGIETPITDERLS